MIRKLPPTISKEQFLKILESTNNPDHKLFLILLYYSGLRVAEACALDIKDIDFREGIIKVVSGKGGKDRLIPIAPQLKSFLRDYLKINPRQGRLILVGPRAINYALKAAGARAGVPGLHPHTLRHSFATWVEEKTNDLNTVKSLLGHEDIKTTQIYLHTTTEGLKAAMEKAYGK